MTHISILKITQISPKFVFGSETELYLTLFNSNFGQKWWNRPIVSSLSFSFPSHKTQFTLLRNNVIDFVNRGFTIWVLGRLFQVLDLLGAYYMNYERDTNPAAGDICVSLKNQLAQCYYVEHLLEKQKAIKLQQGLTK